MSKYFLAFDKESSQFVVRTEDEYGNIYTHSTFHKREVAANTVRELNLRAEKEEQKV